MSTPVLRLAEPSSDSVALCALARLCPQGRHLRFYHQRDHYWERCRLHKDSEVQVVDVAGQPAATATFARKKVWLSGAHRSAVYVFDVMVHPDRRGLGLARLLLDAIHRRNADAELFYAYILSDNHPSRRLFEKAGYRAALHRLLYHPVLPAWEGRRPTGPLRETASPEETAAIDADLRERYDFLDTTVGHDAVYLLEQGGERAWAALRRHGPQVFVELPWYAALVGRVLPVVPTPGKPVTVWSLHHTGSRSPELLRRLIRSVAGLAAQAGINALALPLFQDDPLTAAVTPLTLTRWGVPPGRVHLYAAGPAALLVLAAHRPLVFSGQDG